MKEPVRASSARNLALRAGVIGIWGILRDAAGVKEREPIPPLDHSLATFAFDFFNAFTPPTETNKFT